MNNFIFLAEASGFVDPVGDGTAWADRLARFTGLGIQTFLLGICTVFAVLAILWGCLEVFRYVFYTIPEKKKAEAAAASAVAPAPEVETEAAVEEYSDDGEIVAAIIAAITAMRNEEAAESGVAPTAFRVVSFRKRR